MLKITKYGVTGKDKIMEYISTYSDVLAKARRVFAFPLPYYYFRQSLDCRSVIYWVLETTNLSPAYVAILPHSRLFKGVKVSPVFVMITINYLFIAHWNPQALSTYKIMFLSAAGAGFQFLNTLVRLRRQLRQPSGDSGSSIPGSPDPRLSHCLHAWQKQVFPLPGSTQISWVTWLVLLSAFPARNPEAASYTHTALTKNGARSQVSHTLTSKHLVNVLLSLEISTDW